MSGDAPPPRPPFSSWPTRPPRRRPPPPSRAWPSRRPRTPPPFRPRRPPFKHRSFVAPTSQSMGYHPHPLPRNLQNRIRSPPRSPRRDPPYRGEPGPSHRVEPLQEFRPDRGKRADFRPEARPPDPPYRGEPGPLFRADMPPRDEYERRDERYQAHWFRQPGKIYKPLKRKRRGSFHGPGGRLYSTKPDSPSHPRSSMQDRVLRHDSPNQNVDDRQSDIQRKVERPQLRVLDRLGEATRDISNFPIRMGPTKRLSNGILIPDRLERMVDPPNTENGAREIPERGRLRFGGPSISGPPALPPHLRGIHRRAIRDNECPRGAREGIVSENPVSDRMNIDSRRSETKPQNNTHEEKEQVKSAEEKRRSEAVSIPGSHASKHEKKAPIALNVKPNTSNKEKTILTMVKPLRRIHTTDQSKAGSKSKSLDGTAENVKVASLAALKATPVPELRTGNPSNIVRSETSVQVLKSSGNEAVIDRSSQHATAKKTPNHISEKTLKVENISSDVTPSKDFSRLQEETDMEPLASKPKLPPRSIAIPAERASGSAQTSPKAMQSRSPSSPAVSSQPKSPGSFKSVPIPEKAPTSSVTTPAASSLPAPVPRSVPAPSAKAAQNAVSADATSDVGESKRWVPKSVSVHAPLPPSIPTSVQVVVPPAAPAAFSTPVSVPVPALVSLYVPASAPVSVPIPSSIPAFVPVSVPASAMSFLKSSPKPHDRSPSLASTSGKVSSLAPVLSSKVVDVPQNAEPQRVENTKTELLSQIHDIGGKISAVERKLMDLRKARKEKEMEASLLLEESKSKNENSDPNLHQYLEIARAVAGLRVSEDRALDRRSRIHPLHREGWSLLSQNRSVAAASHASLRHVCSDTELGLDAIFSFESFVAPKVPEGLREKMKSYLLEQRRENIEQKKRLSREYSGLLMAWRKKLITASERRSREKRDAIRERDRFLLLCTKGTSALLTSRTSSGRTSTKLVPSVGINGQMNGTAELDALLSEIDTHGGTPGAKSIWGKTLATIPNQDVSQEPLDCMSVLVDNPIADYHASRAVNPWNYKEVIVYLEKYLAYSKNFRKIASFLEHKTSRDCGHFYYMNKLRIGLKQLCKEASSLKRKGLLRSHIENLAKKHFFVDERADAKDSFVVGVSNSISRVPEKLGAGHEYGSVYGSSSSRHSDRRDVHSFPMKRSDRIMSDNRIQDLSGIERKAFAQAILRYGTEWRQVSTFMGVPGKSTADYREYYRRNRRKLESEDSRDHGRAKLLVRTRTPPPIGRMSPKVSPRPSLGTSGPTVATKVKGIDKEEIVLLPIQLGKVSGQISSGQRTPGKGISPTTPGSSKKGDCNGSSSVKCDGDVRKPRPTATWTLEDREQFRILFKKHKRDWKAIAQRLPGKTPAQIKGYWRNKVAHESSDGFQVEKEGKPQKKRTRRSSSDSKKTDRGEATDSLQKKHSAGSSSMALGIGAASDKNSTSDPMEVDSERKSEERSRAKGATDIEMEDPNAGVNSDRGTRNNTSGDDSSRSKGLSSSRLPLPMLRSVPRPRDSPNSSPRSSDERRGKERGRFSTASSDGKLQDELRRAAESYGVLELLGDRIGGGSKRGSEEKQER